MSGDTLDPHQTQNCPQIYQMVTYFVEENSRDLFYQKSIIMIINYFISARILDVHLEGATGDSALTLGRIRQDTISAPIIVPTI